MLYTFALLELIFFSPEFLLFHPMIKSPLHSFYSFVIFFLNKNLLVYFVISEVPNLPQKAQRGHTEEF